METSCFDAVIDSAPTQDAPRFEASLLFEKESIPATVHFYPGDSGDGDGHRFVRVHTSRPVSICWGNRFRLRGKGRTPHEIPGNVLLPEPGKVAAGRVPRHLLLLKRLAESPEEMLAALVRESGMGGLEEDEIARLTGLSHERIRALGRQLELTGVLKILNFSPIFMLDASVYQGFLQKLVEYVETSHRDNPELAGLEIKQLSRRFNAPARAVRLALARLLREGRLEWSGELVVPSGFQLVLSDAEEKILSEMEELSFQGKLQTVSIQELQLRFNLNRARMDRLMNQLIERKKVVQGKDGYLLHSDWLGKMIEMLKDSGLKELSVADFKQMTGLTRKYAIPLLELLDQMGITRRIGSTREIL